MSVTRLTLLLACLGLAISRVGLVLHELVGHGGVALAHGGGVVEVTFFWFAGGWIRTTVPVATESSRLLVALGGIAAEVTVGAAALALGRGAVTWPRAALVARLAGLALVVHGLWYAATGTWHGFGDGALLHERLGAARYPVALALGAALCALALLGARALVRAFAPALHGSPRRRLLAVLTAAALASASHAALTFGEVALRRDATYQRTMQTTAQRRADDALARWRAEAAGRGVVPDERALADAAAALRRPPPFPFARWLAAAALLAFLLGVASLRRAALAPGALPPRALRRMVPPAALVAALAVATVALLDRC
jgi:hypothetical protein